MLWQHFTHQLQHLLPGVRSQLCVSICSEMAKERRRKGNSCLVLRRRWQAGSETLPVLQQPVSAVELNDPLAQLPWFTAAKQHRVSIPTFRSWWTSPESKIRIIRHSLHFISNSIKLCWMQQHNLMEANVQKLKTLSDWGTIWNIIPSCCVKM